MGAIDPSFRNIEELFGSSQKIIKEHMGAIDPSFRDLTKLFKPGRVVQVTPIDKMRRIIL